MTILVVLEFSLPSILYNTENQDESLCIHLSMLLNFKFLQYGHPTSRINAFLVCFAHPCRKTKQNSMTFEYFDAPYK